jgi:RNA-directed DNA polymerase
MHLKRTAAAGIDGLTWRQYEEGLAERIEALWEAIQAGCYRALPSRRVYIPKANGKQRPPGIAALEDKIVQQAVVLVLTPIYEVDFLWFSYGFRPGATNIKRWTHCGWDCTGRRVNYVLDARYPVVLRYHRSRLDGAFPRAADCGSTHPASNTQMAHRRNSGLAAF